MPPGYPVSVEKYLQRQLAAFLPYYTKLHNHKVVQVLQKKVQPAQLQ